MIFWITSKLSLSPPIFSGEQDLKTFITLFCLANKSPTSFIPVLPNNEEHARMQFQFHSFMRSFSNSFASTTADQDNEKRKKNCTQAPSQQQRLMTWNLNQYPNSSAWHVGHWVCNAKAADYYPKIQIKTVSHEQKHLLRKRQTRKSKTWWRGKVHTWIKALPSRIDAQPATNVRFSPQWNSWKNSGVEAAPCDCESKGRRRIEASELQKMKSRHGRLSENDARSSRTCPFRHI